MIKIIVKNIFFLIVSILIYIPGILHSQNTNYGVEISKAAAGGLIISNVTVQIKNDSSLSAEYLLRSDEIKKTFAVGAGMTFEINVFDLAISNVRKLDFISRAEYKLFSSGFSDNITLIIYAELITKDQKKKEESKGILVKGKGLEDFPVLIENNYSKLSLILTGGIGVFNDNNAFFGHGEIFTKGSPIAKNPAGPGNSTWGEGSLELGIGGLAQLGSLPVYPYFGVSGLMTGATGQDLYTSETRGFTDFEKAYLGILFENSKKGFVANLSAGRQNFLLNDGFLFSRYSGSANAGQRASLFLSARTTFEKTALLKIKYNNFILEGAFLEPEELDFSPSNTQYLLGTFGYNNNSTVNTGFSYISIVSSNSKYPNVNGVNMTKVGLYAFNPKLWLTSSKKNYNINLRSEFVYEGNRNFDMGAYAYYATLSYQFNKLMFNPKLSYRYSYMSGDDSATVKYERFDPMLTGGLGNWIQGLNFRKVIGSGNIAAHRVELNLYPKSDMLLSIDFFYLLAPQLFNLGGLPPLSRLPDNTYGQELTLTYKYFISNKFTLLSVISTAFPGNAIKQSFNTPSDPWTTIQMAFFIHIL
ncbi:MAG TPA: alginate export family protein [Ignavibacteria bacterium]|nr:alginate export family protein [Ignavibacteria bacterium]